MSRILLFDDVYERGHVLKAAVCVVLVVILPLHKGGEGGAVYVIQGHNGYVGVLSSDCKNEGEKPGCLQNHNINYHELCLSNHNKNSC